MTPKESRGYFYTLADQEITRKVCSKEFLDFDKINNLLDGSEGETEREKRANKNIEVNKGTRAHKVKN